ncbi:hypothetical protein S7S_04040 [Isoalcanivorax pacificus W11-5]|uniref:Lipoprotein n=1 Tax=Isoalcanivorax pacificus W11-5 TaxID=391936 RepID=A0A0B4XKK3_9GAMM|nr:hypothetical protein [Isoalcanivorax pacificus]AJD47230.1 hypothetical protein S7S_04040 [Isoalcanivorax pacificus W11-5]
MRLFACLFVFTLLSACTTTGTPIHRDSVFNVGVVSLLGKDINIAYLGVTAFGNRRDQIDATAIDLHGNIQDQLVTLVRAHGQSRFNVTVPDYDLQPWLDALAEPVPLRSALMGNERDNEFRKLAPLVQSLLAQHPMDALILLTPHRAYTGTPMEPFGAALYAGGRNGGVIWSYAGIFSEIWIINGKDGSLAHGRRLRVPASFNVSFKDDYPVRDLRDTPIFDVVTRVPTEADLDALSDAFSKLITAEHVEAALDGVL